MFQAAEMSNDSFTFLLRFVTEERNAVPNTTRNMPSPWATSEKTNNQLGMTLTN